jgi:hypothetical protein
MDAYLATLSRGMGDTARQWLVQVQATVMDIQVEAVDEVEVETSIADKDDPADVPTASALVDEEDLTVLTATIEGDVPTVPSPESETSTSIADKDDPADVPTASAMVDEEDLTAVTATIGGGAAPFPSLIIGQESPKSHATAYLDDSYEHTLSYEQCDELGGSPTVESPSASYVDFNGKPQHRDQPQIPPTHPASPLHAASIVHNHYYNITGGNIAGNIGPVSGGRVQYGKMANTHYNGNTSIIAHFSLSFLLLSKTDDTISDS